MWVIHCLVSLVAAIVQISGNGKHTEGELIEAPSEAVLVVQRLIRRAFCTALGGWVPKQGVLHYVLTLPSGRGEGDNKGVAVVWDMAGEVGEKL